MYVCSSLLSKFQNLLPCGLCVSCLGGTIPRTLLSPSCNTHWGVIVRGKQGWALCIYNFNTSMIQHSSWKSKLFLKLHFDRICSRDIPLQILPIIPPSLVSPEDSDSNPKRTYSGLKFTPRKVSLELRCPFLLRFLFRKFKMSTHLLKFLSSRFWSLISELFHFSPLYESFPVLVWVAYHTT